MINDPKVLILLRVFNQKPSQANQVDTRGRVLLMRDYPLADITPEKELTRDWTY